MSLQNFLRRAHRASSKISMQCRAYSAPSNSPTPTQKSKSKAAPVITSSCAPDTIMAGLNYLKNQPPVLALPDEEYPPWLWTILQPKELEDDGPGGRKERMERRKANKERIKERNFMSTQ
ncbi:hypothetical protein GYMLUDRAFT_827251 [Collybiopsis luxurians FD-317 M1]|uniref:Large ribosomal subunit protein mL54 n=1 Tax=Collybiopsis luxurians FD-317 M1 TaxID=944289 RepID=A0A0D0AZL4_9AGAR|nr:hypothetical protein GYMLUDRAFT_827251 [Collybiopsis luxurians FD-317 M1]